MERKEFTHDFVQLPEIKRVMVEGKRHYQLSDGECVPYPSVTTVLSGCKKTKKALHEWRRRVGAETANKVSRQATERGTSVHQLIEDYCMNKDSEGKIMPNAADMFSRLRDVADESIDNIKLIEGLMYSEYLRSAGTVDMVAEFNGTLSVIDWKTSTRRKTRSKCYNYFKQESAYAVMFEEMTGMPVTQLVTIVTDQEGGSQVFVEHRDEWIGEFIELRDQYERENNTGLQSSP